MAVVSCLLTAIGKGGKNRRRGKNENETEKRELVFKEDGQGLSPTHQTDHSLSSLYGSEYAQVIKMLGNGRLEALCFDGIKRLCHIRGKLRKKVLTNDLAFCETRSDRWMSCVNPLILCQL